MWSYDTNKSSYIKLWAGYRRQIRKASTHLSRRSPLEQPCVHVIITWTYDFDKSQHLQLWIVSGSQIWVADTAFGEESFEHCYRVTGKVIIKWSLDPDKFQDLWLTISYDY